MRGRCQATFIRQAESPEKEGDRLSERPNLLCNLTGKGLIVGEKGFVANTYMGMDTHREKS